MANIGYIQVVRHCNQYCRFCSNPETEYMLDVETAKKQIDDFVLRGYFGIILTGGEPSLSPHIPEITRYAVSRGLHARMITNGSRVADLNVARSFAEAGLHHYHVSIHSSRPEVENFLTGVKNSFEKALAALENLSVLAKEYPIAVNINTVINAYNADHLDETVRFFVEKFPLISHFVWNNLDPSMGRAETNRDTAPRFRDFEVSLSKAMRYLDKQGKSFRVERVPLCFMTEFAHCSTETRKIVKGEERIVHFLDEKGTVRQTDFKHLKSAACRFCSLDDICAGAFDLGDWYDPEELSPVFIPKEPIVQKILSEENPRSAPGVDAVKAEGRASAPRFGKDVSGAERTPHPFSEKPPEKRHWVRLTRVCNDHCSFCLDTPAWNGTAIPWHAVVSDLEKGRSLEIKRLVLSGGEPTIHPDFIQIVAKAREMGYDHIQTVTNGRRMCYPDFMNGAVKAGLKEITFSLHGHTPEIHDRLTGSPGSFVQGLVALRRALKIPGLIVSVDVVINKQNIRHLRDILDFFIHEGVHEFDLLQVIPFGSAWENKEELFYDVEAELPHLHRALEVLKRGDVVLWTNRLLPQYLEGYEDLIQPPSKLHDEASGRGVLFDKFLHYGIKPDCWGRCPHCFLQNLCGGIAKLNEEKKLKAYPLPECLKEDGEAVRDFEEAGKLEIEHSSSPDFKMKEYVEFHIRRRYFAKGKACRGCRLNDSCAGAPIQHIRRKGFPKPTPALRLNFKTPDSILAA